MDKFDLKKYLAEGKLFEEEKYSGAIIRKGSSDKAKEDTKIVRQALKKAGIKFTNRGEFGMDFKDADLAQIKKVIAGEKVGEFVVSRDVNEGKLLKEAKEMDMAKSFLENKGLEVEAVKSGNEGNDKAGEEGKAFIWDGGEGDMNYKSDGKEAFYVYMPFNEEIMKEMKSKFPVIKIGGKSGNYYEVIIEKK